MLLLQPFKSCSYYNRLSWKQECSKLSQVLLLKIWARKGVIRCGQVKNYGSRTVRATPFRRRDVSAMVVGIVLYEKSVLLKYSRIAL